MTVLELWLFAEKIKCIKLQNYSVNFIQEYYLQDAVFIDFIDLKYVAGATKHDYARDNPLRKFCALQLHYQNNNGEHEAVHQAILNSSDIINLYLEYEGTYWLDSEFDPRSRGINFSCEFHVHDDDEDREDCQIKLE
ncbi:uncharacterized protein EAF01_008522 [Botrytis porri]|uniref:Uncharacterized protein n=1 Tax=Botrytis porri TaxID=87229 RepID=A0A4Z1KC30_9HELO|nr:uncharacterized protein EAF01_008522 [Botrytis porri]KAF7899309.1 hypothetical protein EAF01_008522 [Botrytis porri]TGO82936.1 hypothetical protein BPOR_0730g00030 [Botrytis porri]